MAEAFIELQKEAPSNERSFAEKLGHMVDREWTARENRRLSRLLRAAKLTSDASLEDVWIAPGRGIAKATIRELASCGWIDHRHNVICVGKTGCGKSYLAAALARALGTSRRSVREHLKAAGLYPWGRVVGEASEEDGDDERREGEALDRGAQRESGGAHVI